MFVKHWRIPILYDQASSISLVAGGWRVSRQRASDDQSHRVMSMGLCGFLDLMLDHRSLIGASPHLVLIIITMICCSCADQSQQRNGCGAGLPAFGTLTPV